MPAAPLPPDETDRLAALIALRLLDTEQTESFDVFPALARDLFAVPISAISLIDKDRHWLKAGLGLGDVVELPRAISLCAHAILTPAETLCVPDATKDARFADNPLVTGEFGLRFYAGAPVIGPSGHALGALCIIDRRPREVGDEALEQLRLLAVGVGSALRLHGSNQALEDLGRIDALTGLQNRSGFARRLRAALAPRDGQTCPATGLLLLDLDGFKSVNGLFGHRGGDAALTEVARRLRRVGVAQNQIGRFGGDTFCILVENVVDRGALQGLADAVHAALREPFRLQDQAVPLQTSIGVAIRSARGCDPEKLVFDADVALSAAKWAGRGVTRFAAAADEVRDSAARLGRRAMHTRLRDALVPPGREPFTLAFQPLFRTRTEALVGFEALVRWPDRNGPTMQPGEFIPVAEATGLIVQLDHWVLNEACAVASSWPSPIQVSSNLSAANFFAGDLVEEVRAILARHDLPPTRLKLEITETVLLHEPVRVRRIIAGLRAMGVRIVLDDFGAGHGSVTYLRDYPFDGLKVDRGFTAELEADARSRALTRAIIEMARVLDIEVTVEGVETEGQLDILRGTDVATVQGYLLGRPMPPRAAFDLAWQRTCDRNGLARAGATAGRRTPG